MLIEKRSDSLDSWIERKKIHLALLIFAVSLLIRGIYFLELRNTPTLHITQFPQTDMNFFDKWAKVILSGDLLTNRNLHPHHPWNLQIASEETWNRWYGYHIFHQEPLYPYFLALVYRLFGERIFALFWIQFLLGSLANALLFLAGLRYFSPRAALATGIMATLYGLSPFFEGGLLRTSPGFFLNTSLLLLIASNLEKDGWQRWFLLGLLFGISYLLRSTTIVFLALFMLYILIRQKKQIRVGIERTAPLLVGFAVMLVPLVLRNVAVGAKPLSITSLAAVNFANANAPDKGAPGFWTSKYCKEILSHSDGEFLPTVRETLRVHRVVIGSYRRLAMKVWKEFLFFWRWPEISDNYCYYYARQDSLILKPMLTYGMISALAIGGMILSFGKARYWAFPLLLLATYALVSVIFCENSRLRHPAVPGLLLFAGAALAELTGQITKRRRLFSIAAIAFGFLVVYSGTGKLKPKDFIRRFDQKRGIEYYLKAGKTSKALELLESERSDKLFDFDKGYYFLELNLPSRAFPHFEADAESDPDSYLSWKWLGYAYLACDRKAEAIEAWEKSLAINPGQDDLAELVKKYRRKPQEERR